MVTATALTLRIEFFEQRPVADYNRCQALPKAELYVTIKKCGPDEALMIRVFISHKKEDSDVAAKLAGLIGEHKDCRAYVDLLDAQLAMNGDDLGNYFRKMISDCTHLMAVVSGTTAASWWVPFEIGIATEKQYPLSTFTSTRALLPEYLHKWPYLFSDADVRKYLQVAVTVGSSVLRKNILTEDMKTASVSERASYTRLFHATLKRELGQ
jgi:hypothetical protein